MHCAEHYKNNIPFCCNCKQRMSVTMLVNFMVRSHTDQYGDIPHSIVHISSKIYTVLALLRKI